VIRSLSLGYFREGFLTLQRALDTVIIDFLSGTCLDKSIIFQIQRFPILELLFSPLIQLLPIILPAIFALNATFLIQYFIRALCMDKENNLTVRNNRFIQKLPINYKTFTFHRFISKLQLEFR